MKSAKKLLMASAFAIATILISFGAGCTNPVADTLGASNWGLVGSWTNPAYGASYSLPKCSVLTMNADGSFRSSSAGGGGASSSGTYNVDSVSVSGGARLYQIHFAWGTSYAYVLARTSDGNTVEVQAETYAVTYPTVINPNDYYNYATYSRQ